jgi:hypothetical protein
MEKTLLMFLAAIKTARVMVNSFTDNSLYQNILPRQQNVLGKSGSAGVPGA